MKNKLNITWRDVYEEKVWRAGHISRAQDTAKQLGYLYFVWNERVYTWEGKDTGLTVDDL